MPIRNVTLWRLGLAVVLATLGAMLFEASGAQSQNWSSAIGPARVFEFQSPIVQPVATADSVCGSVSSKSRRCHFTFGADCKKLGHSPEHCTQMSGFCHACTDSHVSCAAAARDKQEKAKATTRDCSGCNAAYSRCIVRMIEQYKLSR